MSKPLLTEEKLKSKSDKMRQRLRRKHNKEKSAVKKMAEKFYNKFAPFSSKIIIAGSIRRGVEDPKDIDLLIVPKKNQRNKINRILKKYKPIRLGDQIVTIQNKGVNIDIHFTKEKNWGAHLMFLTGPKGYNIGLRMGAKKRGMKLNQYGLWDRDTGKLIASNEWDIYEALGKEFKYPHLRGDEWKKNKDIVQMLKQIKNIYETKSPYYISGEEPPYPIEEYGKWIADYALSDNDTRTFRQLIEENLKILEIESKIPGYFE